MKIAFVTEFFLPFSAGGGEWSIFYLAKALKKRGVEVVILTPKLFETSNHSVKNIKVIRFPFYAKLINFNKFPGHFFYTNPLWIIWSAIFIYIYLRRENPDVIHIQGKYSIPPVVLANFFLKKPTVATIRDNIVVCNYGICLMSKDKPCNLIEYFLNDFPAYYKIYVDPKNFLTAFSNIIFAIWGRTSRNLLRIAINQIDKLTVLSKKQGQILRKSKIDRPIIKVPSVFNFKKPSKTPKDKIIIYAGRITYGKGAELLIKAFALFRKSFPDYQLMIIGTGKLNDKIRLMSSANKNIKFLGRKTHEQLMGYYQRAKLTVVPSIWPDPLPRVALESISQGTPVVVSDKGGLPEVVEEDLFGYVARPDKHSMSKAMIRAIKNNEGLRKNIKSNFSRLKSKYDLEVINKHLDIYNSLLK